MALLFWDSFDHYATSDIDEKYTSSLVSAGGAIAVGAYGRNSTDGIRIVQFSTGGTYVRGPLTSSPDVVTLGVGYYTEYMPTTYMDILLLLDIADTQLRLRQHNDGSMEILRGATSLGFSTPGDVLTDVYYYLEIQATIDNAAGAVEVRLNETPIIDLSGIDTQASANARVTQFQLGGAGPGTGEDRAVRHDDLYVCDDAGGYCNDFLGDTRVCTLLPNGVGAHADWTPLVGPANWQDVDENPPDDDTTYNASGTATDRDSFAMDDLPGGVTGTVHAVCAVINARKDDAGTRTIDPAVRSGGADYDGTGVNVPNTYAFHIMYPWETDPDTAAPWLIAAVNAVEGGYELTA